MADWGRQALHTHMMHCSHAFTDAQHIPQTGPIHTCLTHIVQLASPEVMHQLSKMLHRGLRLCSVTNQCTSQALQFPSIAGSLRHSHCKRAASHKQCLSDLYTLALYLSSSLHAQKSCSSCQRCSTSFRAVLTASVRLHLISSTACLRHCNCSHRTLTTASGQIMQALPFPSLRALYAALMSVNSTPADQPSVTA